MFWMLALTSKRLLSLGSGLTGGVTAIPPSYDRSASLAVRQLSGSCNGGLNGKIWAHR